MVTGGLDAATFGGNLGIVMITGIVFTVFFLPAGYVFRIQEIRELIDRLIGKIKGRDEF
jgi:hypothetical protein